MAAIGPGPGALVFIGFMGAGKSSAARAAAEALGVAAVDTDELLERELGMPIREFFEREGEEAFRARERELVSRVLDRSDGGAIALGGGSLLSEEVQRAVGRHTVVLLEASADTAWDRVVNSSRPGRRPLASDEEGFRRLHAERAPLYNRFADAVVPADRQVVKRALPALRALGEAPPSTRMLWACSASGDYPVFVGPGLLESGMRPSGPGRPFLVTDRNVNDLYGASVEPVAGAVIVEAGERSKTVETAELVWRSLAQQGMAGDDHVLALGGGVVGDLAGFCAATYQRGVPVVHVPTTLVAQVDSAYGGKTGVDLPEAKNYVGAYHQPAAVLVDPATLLTLPEAELAAGYAEVVKTALIAGGALWERVREGAGGAASPEVILACARTKLAIVAQDERDAGARQALNLGHTVGHGIEAATGYGRYRHGEAVGLGLLAALRLSGLDELRDEVAGLLSDHGLPLRLEGAEIDAVIEATALDKKRAAGETRFVLLDGPGEVRIGMRVADDDLRAAVAELTD